MMNIIKMKPGGKRPPSFFRDLAWYFAGILSAHFGSTLMSLLHPAIDALTL